MEWMPGEGFWKYRCSKFGQRYSVAQLRAILAYRDVPPAAGNKKRQHSNRGPELPGRIEVSRWAELLDYEAGLREPVSVPVIIPAGITAAARLVAEDIRLLLGLRESEKWGTEPFVYSRRFAQARTGLTEGVVRGAIQELLRRGVIVRHRGRRQNDRREGDPRRGAQPYYLGVPPGSDDDALIRLLEYALDAVELLPRVTPE
jgi:hypothetical protein